MPYRYLRTLIVFISLLLTLSANGQFVNFGQSRASIQWKQIKTADFQLIYPDFFEKNAQKMANICTQLYQHTNTLQQKPKRMSIIIHADGGISNGNVALAPRKTELYTMPSQEATDSYLEHLCVHEFRHIVQFDKVKQGTTKGLSYLLGDIFPIAVVGLYLPMWFMEGDAVAFETSIENLGRGRSPEFLNEMKAQVIEKGIYHYSKAVLGSEKDFVPNRYTMGYFMTANARINYGADIWSKALTRTGRRPFGITPFSKSLSLSMKGKRDALWQDSTFQSLFINADSVKEAHTFTDAKRTLYRDNFAELQQIWKRETEKIKHNFDTIQTDNKQYTNYYYPTTLANGDVISYKKGLQQTGAFVLHNQQTEKRLTRTGIVYDYKFASNNHKIVWSEYDPHIRWQQGGRMRLSSYDLNTKKYKHYRNENNCFSPFKIGNKWGFIEVNHRNQAFIIITDSTLQKEEWRLAGEFDELFIHPSYADGKIITVVQTSQGLHLERIDVRSRQRQKITEAVAYEIDSPVALDSTIIYRASYNGNNALYQLNNGEKSQILSGRYGVRFPHLSQDKKQLIFSFYTSDGYKPGQIDFSKIKTNPVEYKTYRLADSMKQQENLQLSLTNDSIFSTRKYNKFSHLFNIHSWAPVAVDLNNMDFELGAVVYSQNKLSTLSFTAGYALKSGYEHGRWILNATYSGWWPNISINLESGKDNYESSGSITNLQTDSIDDLYLYNKAQRSEADLIVQLPFNLSSKQYNRYFRPYFRYTIEGLHNINIDRAYTYHSTDSTAWIQAADQRNYNIDLSARYYQLMEYGIRYNNQTRMTSQEINPRWGQSLASGYTHSLNKGLKLGSQWWVDGQLYFPGILTNHSLSIYGGFQQMSDQTRSFGNKILYPRGISLYGYEIASLRSSYELPLLFPDQQLGSLLYFKKIAGALFYDLGSSRSIFKTHHYSSYGVELTTDSHFFQLTYPIHMGVRSGYETQTKKMFVDLIFSVGISI